MIGKRAASHDSTKRFEHKHQFLVHLLKVTRLSTQIASSNEDGIPHQPARRDALKVTALYNSHQIALGDFPVWMNECIIDRKLTCQFSVSKPDTHSKLHLYIDQICSSGLTGHLALDLHEFIREDESEIHVKYPLYANIARFCKGPVLKIVIKSLGITKVDSLFEEENDILLLPSLSFEQLHDNGVHRMEDGRYTMHDGHFDLNGRAIPRHVDEASFSQLEGALSDIGEKLKTLVASFRSRDQFQTGDNSGPEFDYQSSTTSPLLSSLHTGTSVDSRSEIYEEQCTTDSDDVCDSSFDLGRSAYPLSIPRHSRGTSEFSSHTAKLKQTKSLRQGHQSIEEALSEAWRVQSNISGKSHPSEHHCPEECFICSSERGLKSYEGLQQASLSRSKAISLRSKSFQLNTLEANKARMSAPVIETELSTVKSGKNESAVVPRKGSGLLKGLFGAVVVAGVSVLGVRNSQMSRERTQSINARTNLARTSSGSLSSDVRSERVSRQRYSFRR